jgi:hypothetical protein
LNLKEKWRHLPNGEVNVHVLYCVNYTKLIERQARHIPPMKEIKNTHNSFRETGEIYHLGASGKF